MSDSSKIIHDVQNSMVKIKSIIKLIENNDYDSIEELSEMLDSGEKELEKLNEFWILFKNSHTK